MVAPTQGQTEVRLGDLVAALSLATDLATGQRLEHGLRRALLAVWLGEELGLSNPELSDVYYVALLGTVGCTLEAAVFSPYLEDEIAFGERLVTLDPTRPIQVAAYFLTRAGQGDPLLTRARKVVSVALTGPTQSAIVCRDVATQVGDMLDMGSAVREAVGQCHEHWDGKGWPEHLKGEEISLPARIFLLAHDVEIFNRLGGMEAAVAVVERRSGKLYDPHISASFSRMAAQLLPRLESEATWDAVLAAEPLPVRSLSPEDLDAMTEAIANFVDARSRYTLGHSRGVALRAEAAARHLGLSEVDAATVRRAGLLHDLGRAGVPVTVWEKDASLDEADWERMKRHPSLTELLLARSDTLGPLGTLAGLHHERLDGSGYRGVTAAFLPTAARILAVADTYETKLERRPHRRAMTPEEAAEDVRRQANQGLLDPEAVDAVLEAAGQAPRPERRAWPADLTDREVEVLRLAVQGLSNRQMAEALVVSPKTVGRHIEHIYQKIGVSTRVGAALFALHHDLVETS